MTTSTGSIVTEAHQAFYSRILEILAGRANLQKTLMAIVIGIETMHPEMLCSILLSDEDGKRLRSAIAPSLPDLYNVAIDGIEIAVGQGSCGTAAFLGERVVAEDIATHPYWRKHKELAARAGLSACWSQPILSSSRQLLGVFAIYHREANSPNDVDIDLIERSARLASIAVENNLIEEELRENKTFVQSILDSVTSQIAVIDEAGTIVSTNEAWRQFSLENSSEPGKMTPHTDIGTNYLDCCGKAVDSNPESLDARTGIQAVLDGRIPKFSLEYPCHTLTRQRWFIMTATPLRTGKNGAVIVHTDISERKLAEEQISKLAFYDPLTNLANRRLLLDRLRQSVAESKRSGKYCAVMFLDLDNFKPLNDLYGHDVGDLLLIEAARRLKHSVREADTVARFGGDEFVVMLGQISDDIERSLSQAKLVAEKMRATLSSPYTLGSASDGETGTVIDHQCTVSIGITLFNGQETDQDEILKRADAAMYKAKQSGRNTIECAAQPLGRVGLHEFAPERLVQLNWHSAYQSGNALIDDQHRALIETSNQLLAAILTNDTVQEVAALIDSLLRSVVQHFEDEEALLAAVDFPGATAHATTHRRLLERAYKLVDRFQTEAFGIGELFEFLVHDVVARHMHRSDLEFFPYLKGQRLAQGSVRE